MTARANLAIAPIDPQRDAPLLHQWLTHPRSVYWEMQDATVEDVEAQFQRINDDPHHHARLGFVDGRPEFIVETYNPRYRELVGVPEIEDGDLGMHVLVAPPAHPRPGFTREVFRAVMQHCFADPAVARVVVEPDIRNLRIARLNKEAGFTIVRQIEMPTKTSALSFCTRDAFADSPLGAHR
ncbi:acetyltransferase [Hoyosella sp. G463]|uniref:Lysine N-acyltransferase MbtK n=1 Tax=Lolliginicoccus lacisalsi TaxID=2742202 RepID=A0A927J949_9ACTN|nr:GNAT family N-acetyltransferase [Lolliginicoccus lacisalsi]MBD8504883.1 acetyltransferase [Lolliginicoccus lacisalsi]